MDANDVLQAIGVSAQADAVASWVMDVYRGLRSAVMSMNASQQGESANAAAAASQSVRSVCAKDVNEEYVAGTDFLDVFNLYSFAQRALQKVPPEYPALDEAVFWLARKELLQLISRYANAILLQVSMQRRLHVHNKGLCNVEIKNLFCEPGEDIPSHFIWTGVFVALHRSLTHAESDEMTLGQLAEFFSDLADIYYNLTDAVYATKLVLKCRRAFSAFWRRLGTCSFAPYYEEYAKCRAALDTAIVSDMSIRFLNIELCLATLAQSLLGIHNSLTTMQAQPPAQSPVAVTNVMPVKRGPKGKRKIISVRYAAEVYGVSCATICNWDKNKGSVPSNYQGRNVPLDAFNSAAAKDYANMGHQQGVMKRVSQAIRQRGKK